MGLVETEETNQFTFERFAAHQFYTDVNRLLVKQALAHLVDRPTTRTLTIVDMACGTGAISRLIAQEMERHGLLSRLHLIGVDPSAEALRHARAGMDELGLPVQADFIKGEADDLPNLVQGADAAFFCNAIHLVSDKTTAFRQMATILAPGGIFACNSSFYEGAYFPGTERFYRLWTRRAIGWLRKEHPDLRPSREEHTMAMQWLTPDEYVGLFKDSGFSDVEIETDNVFISIDAWRDLGHYWLFIDGALPGVPLPVAAQALDVAASEAGNELGLAEVARTWLQIVATKQ
jgi:ubiquinone/menaquinone biosynthesis C-methylase UbiE